MSRQFWSEQIAWGTNSGSVVGSTVTETILFPNITIPANYMNDGRTLVLRAMGQYTTTNPAPTAIIGLRWGGVAGTLMAKTAATTVGASVSAALWEVEIDIQSRSNGTTASVMTLGHANFDSGLAQAVSSIVGKGVYTNMSSGGVLTPTTASLDVTADTALALTWTWGANAVPNIVQGLNYTIESKN